MKLTGGYLTHVARGIGRRSFALSLVVALGCQGTGIPAGGPRDSDGDGFSDQEERAAFPGSDPLNPDDTPDDPIDTDGDGCSDFDELSVEDSCDNDPNTGIDDPTPGASNVFSLRVARHVDQPVSGPDVDNIFQDAGELLQTAQRSCPDLAADVAFVRAGAIETFDVGGSVVTTEAQLDRLFDLPQDIKVVEAMVGVCGADSSDMTTLLGCSFSEGSVVIIAEAPPDVWAHEWGHVQGLGHRDNCDSNIMHSTELFTNAVNQRERSAFLAPGPRATTSSPRSSRDAKRSAHAWCCQTPLPEVAAWERAGPETVEAWVGRLVTRRYRTGVPAQLAGRIKEDLSAIRSPVSPRVSRRGDLSRQSSVLMLRRRLVDPHLAEHGANVARLIGLVGEVEAVPELMASVVTPTGPLTRDQFNARVEALLALGRLASRDPTGAALEFLMSGTDPQSWSDWGVAWNFHRYEAGALHVLLAKLSVMALGLSNDDGALAHLRGLRERIEAGLLDAATFADQVDEAIASGAVPGM